MDDGTLLPFFTVTSDGKKEYRQIDDLTLAAFEADVQSPDFDGLKSIGMMCARIRAAESERDVAVHMATAASAQLKEVLDQRDIARGIAATNGEHLGECVRERDLLADQIATWEKLVAEVKELGASLQRQFTDATKATQLVRAAALIEVADRCRRDAERATTDSTGVERKTLLAVAEGARELAAREFPSLTKDEIDAALKRGKEQAEAVRKAMDRGGFIP